MGRPPKAMPPQLQTLIDAFGSIEKVLEAMGGASRSTFARWKSLINLGKPLPLSGRNAIEKATLEAEKILATRETGAQK